MTDILNQATSIANGTCFHFYWTFDTNVFVGGVPTGLPTSAIPTQFLGAQTTATSAAATAASVANAAVNTALDIKNAWSSPSNCLHSKYILHVIN